MSRKVTHTVCTVAVLFLIALFAASSAITRTIRPRPVDQRAGMQPSALGSCSGTLSWTQLFPSGTAPDLDSQTFVSDGQGNLIMFGGCGPTGCNSSSNTFVLRDAFGVAGTTSWSQLSTAGGPPAARHGHLLAYDSNLNELIVSGGCAGGCFPLADDIWSLSNANGLDGTTTPTWTNQGTAPNPGFSVGQFAATDSVNHVLMIFGGQDGGGSACSTSGSTEAVDTSTFAVTTLSTTGGPPGEMYFPRGGYDPASNQLLISNGLSCSDNDLWALTNANGTAGSQTWNDILAQGGVNQPPVGNFPSIYSPEANVVFLLEQADTSMPPNLWVLSNANGFDSSNNPTTPAWTKTTPTGAPSLSYIGGVAYDAASDRLLVQVGQPNEVQYWIISCSASPTPTPTPTATPTPTSTPTPTPTPTPSPTATPTPTPTATPTPTPTPTPSPTPTPTPVPTTSPTQVEGSGSIQEEDGSGGEFSMDVKVEKSKKKSKIVGSLTYTDTASGVTLHSSKFSSLTFNGNQAHLIGKAKSTKQRSITFTVDVTDNGTPGTLDSFSIQLSNGYSASGNLSSGDVTVR